MEPNRWFSAHDSGTCIRGEDHASMEYVADNSCLISFVSDVRTAKIGTYAECNFCYRNVF